MISNGLQNKLELLTADIKLTTADDNPMKVLGYAYDVPIRQKVRYFLRT